MYKIYTQEEGIEFIVFCIKLSYYQNVKKMEILIIDRGSNEFT